MGGETFVNGPLPVVAIFLFLRHSTSQESFHRHINHKIITKNYSIVELLIVRMRK